MSIYQSLAIFLDKNFRRLNADTVSIDYELRLPMQSSTTTNAYLSGDMPDEHFFFESESIIDHVDDEEEEEEIEENYFPRTVNRMQSSGVAGLQIKGKVRTLSPVLFYLTNTRYLIISNNELKYLPAGEKKNEKDVVSLTENSPV